MSTSTKRLVDRLMLLSVCAIASTGCGAAASEDETDTTTDASTEASSGDSTTTQTTTDDPTTESTTGASETGADDAIRIVALGDSLTFGTSAEFNSTALEGGYRIRLWELLSQAGHTIDFEGTLSNGPAGFDGDHQSEPGASIEVIGQNWATAVDSVSPHVVLLLAGTNDQLGITADQEPEPAAEALGGLIDQILSDEPQATVVVAKLPPLGEGFLVGADKPARIDAYNALIPGVVEARRAAGASVVLADLSSLDAELLGDGIHPSTMDGYDTMADLWLPAVLEAIDGLEAN